MVVREIQKLGNSGARGTDPLFTTHTRLLISRIRVVRMGSATHLGYTRA